MIDKEIVARLAEIRENIEESRSKLKPIAVPQKTFQDKNYLMKRLADAARALKQFDKALKQTLPEKSHYIDDKLFKQARKEHFDRLETLAGMGQELLTLHRAISKLEHVEEAGAAGELTEGDRMVKKLVDHAKKLGQRNDKKFDHAMQRRLFNSYLSSYSRALSANAKRTLWNIWAEAVLIGKEEQEGKDTSARERGIRRLEKELIQDIRDHRREGMEESLMAQIRPGDRVTITLPRGGKKTGRAVMKGPHGWVLNLGGKHGTPGIATDDNIVKVKKAKKKSYL